MYILNGIDWLSFNEHISYSLFKLLSLRSDHKKIEKVNIITYVYLKPL